MTTIRKRLALWGPLLAVAVVCSSCGGDDGGGPSAPPVPLAASGTASKGAIGGATVNLHSFTASGGMGSLVAGPFTTDTNGTWSGQVPAGTSEALLVVVTGGSYTDEATSNTVTLTSDLYGIWRPSTGKGNASPVTHAMVLNVQQRIIEGATVASAISGAASAMESAFGYDPTSVTPTIVTAKTGPVHTQPSAAELYAVFLAGLSALVDADPTLGGLSGADIWEIILACAADLSDGVLQGTDVFGNPILVDPDGAGPGGLIQIPTVDADDISAWIDAANLWAQTNAPGVVLTNIDLSGFGDTSSGGGQTVSGFLNASGNDAITFGSPFEPIAFGYSEISGTAAFAFGTIDGRQVAVGFFADTKAVVTATANSAGGTAFWIASGLPPSPPISGITVSNQGIEWVVQFDGASLPPNSGIATTDLILNGTLTVIMTE